jgi:NitT/TauT family transport system ATP-binding protein
MQQRVALVRAFALGAPILLMDEPFAALDEMTRAEMRYLLLGLWERHGATVLFVTHSIAEAVMLSDRVVVLTPRPGRVAAVEEVTLARPRHAAQEDTVAFLEHVTECARPSAGPLTADPLLSAFPLVHPHSVVQPAGNAERRR